MGYEYECEEVIKNVIKEVIYFKKGKNEIAGKEIDEIYAKAKCFDKLVKFYSQKDKMPSDEFFDEMGYILKESADDET